MTSRPRSERAGGGHALGTEVGCCSARSCRRTGAGTLEGGGPGPRPSLRALGRRPGRGPQCWDQSQTGQEVAAPVAQGSRGWKAPQTLPSSDPAPVVGRAAVDSGQAGCGQHPRDARLSRCNRGPACLARPARHRFLDTPLPRKAASPHPPGPRPPPPRQGAQPSLPPARSSRPRGPLQDEAGVGTLFFLSFSFLQEKELKTHACSLRLPLGSTQAWALQLRLRLDAAHQPHSLHPAERLGRPGWPSASLCPVPCLGVRDLPHGPWPQAAAHLLGGWEGTCWGAQDAGGSHTSSSPQTSRLMRQAFDFPGALVVRGGTTWDSEEDRVEDSGEGREPGAPPSPPGPLPSSASPVPPTYPSVLGQGQSRLDLGPYSRVPGQLLSKEAGVGDERGHPQLSLSFPQHFGAGCAPGPLPGPPSPLPSSTLAHTAQPLLTF